MPRLLRFAGLCLLHLQANAHTHYNLTDAPVDVVIPSTKKDLSTLNACIAAIKQYGENIRRVIVVSAEPLTDQAEWFNERQYPFSKRDIALQIFQDEVDVDVYMRSPRCRLGWMYQQFLKLYAAYVIPNLSPNILILDSDTIFLRPISFIDAQSHPLFNVGIEHHVPYFEHMGRLHPQMKRIFAERSGITHHMLFQRPVLDDLFAAIREHSNTEPWKAICRAVDSTEMYGSGLSEYEIYFNFVFARTDQVKIRPLKWVNTGDCSDIESFKEAGNAYVSCHAYLRDEPITDSRLDEWETTRFVWDFGIIQSCSRGMNRTPLKYFEAEATSLNVTAYDDLKGGDSIWVQCRFLHTFFESIFPHIRVPVVLVISDGDETFPADCGLSSFEVESLLGHKQVLHVFAQNYDYKGLSDKVSLLPIGMDFHTPAYKGVQGGWGQRGSPREQEVMLKAILRRLLPTSQRVPKAFVDFQHSDTMRAGFKRYLEYGEDRASIFERLQSTGLIDHDRFMPRAELWKRKGEYAFSISPHGNGLDCHRTWEDLVLGCIVIVKTSSLDPLYEGLPVVIVRDWSEITRENLDKWLALYADAFENPSYRERLTHAYWWGKIQNKTRWVTE